jgi:hypothetical protein
MSSLKGLIKIVVVSYRYVVPSGTKIDWSVVVNWIIKFGIYDFMYRVLKNWMGMSPFRDDISVENILWKSNKVPLGTAYW